MFDKFRNWLRSKEVHPSTTQPVQHEYATQDVKNDLARFKTEMRAEIIDLRDIQTKFLEKFYKRFATRKWREENELNEKTEPTIHMYGGKSKFLLGRGRG